jgi:hypothetical protein
MKIRKEIWKGESGKTNSSGNGIIVGFKVPVGKVFALRRVVIWVDGKTPASPSVKGWIGIYRDQNCSDPPFDFVPNSATANTQRVPFADAYGGEPDFDSTECVAIKITGGETSANYTVKVGGYLITEVPDAKPPATPIEK